MTRAREPGRAVALVALALVAGASGRAGAVDLHVDGAAPDASDAGPGTRERPLRTISAGAARAAPGDTVRIAGGTYREFVDLPRGGAPGRPVRLAAVPGARVTIKGSEVVSGWVRTAPGVFSRRAWTVNSQQVFVDGAPLQQVGRTSPFHTRTWGGRPILPARGSGLADLVPGSFFYDGAAATLHVRLPGDADPAAHQVEAAVRDVVVNASVSHVELRGLEFAHSNTSAAPVMRGIVNVEGDGWVIEDCRFVHGDFAGLSLAGAGHRVRASVASDNGNLGIAINGSDAAHGWAPYPGRPPQDILLEGNETSRNNTRGFLALFQAGGVKAANACRGVAVVRHVARDNGGTGVWFDLGCREIRVEGSLLEANTRGVEVETSDGAVVSGNVVVGSAQHGIYVNASSDVVVQDNVLDGNRWALVVHGLPRAEHPRLDRNEIRRNAVRRSGEVDLVLYAGAGAEANASDHNRYDDRAPRLSWAHTDRYAVTHRDLAAFAADTGQERHSVAGGPAQAPAGRGCGGGSARREETP